jgi:ABC-2 type transport system permease protein
MAILYSLWLRQLKRYFRSKARIIGSLGQPILFLVALGFGFGSIYQKAGGGSYIDFLAPGVIGMAILFTSIFAGIEVIWDKQFGFLKEMLVAPVSRAQIMIGRTLGGATVAVFQGILVFLLSFIVGFHPVNWALVPVAIVVMFLVALVFTAMGTAIASMLDDMQGFQLIMNFLVMPLFFLSGALFPLDSAPALLGDIARLDPLSYGVDALRATLIGTSHFGLSLDLAVLAGMSALFIGVGSYLFRKIQI